MRYAIFPTEIDSIDGEGNPVMINICPQNARKSVDGTKWICHNPELAPDGVEPLQEIEHEDAKVLMASEEWSTAEES
jgi:hypothetical protein